MGLGLIVAAMLMGRKMDLKVLPKAGGKERLAAFKDAFWGLLMPVIILGGIYGSVFTPTEAAAVSVFYGLIVGVFIYHEIDFKKMKDILVDSCSTTATVMFITMGATPVRLCSDPRKTGPGHQGLHAEHHRRQHRHLLHHRQHRAADRRAASWTPPPRCTSSRRCLRPSRCSWASIPSTWAP